MFDRVTLARRLCVLAACAAIAVSGCGGEDAAPVTEETDEPSAKVEAQLAEPTSPVSSPDESEPSPDELAARAAFRSMTAEGVSPEEVDTATQQLLDFGSAALPVLVEGLKSEESIKREMAATMLALIGADAVDVADALVEALEDESDFVRANAATALAQMEGQAAHVTPVFGEFLDSEDPNLLTMAVMNLGVLDPDAAKPLIDQLTATLDSDDPAILRPVVELLGKIGPDAMPAIEKIKSLKTSDDAELEMAVNVAVMQIETETE